MALFLLIIQTRCGFTDRETVQRINENPYLQYFSGLKEYRLTKLFSPVAMVKFRKRFNAKRLAKINEHIVLAETSQKTLQSEKEEERDNDHHDNDQNGSGGVTSAKPVETNDEKGNTLEVTPNQGTLILDATCTPADLRYPTDLGLLNEARKKLDEMIDTLHEANGKEQRRPRTYRVKARKDYLNVSKQKSPRKNQLRKAVKNLGIINRMPKS